MIGMTPNPETGTDQAEQQVPVIFRGEYEREMEAWFRRRFLVLCGVFAAWECLAVASITLAVVVTRSGGDENRAATRLAEVLSGAALPAVIISVVATFLILAIFAFVRARRVETRQGLVHEASWMIVLLGGVNLALEAVAAGIGGHETFNPAWSIFFWHFIACLVLPWSPRESIRPMVPLIGAYIVAALVLRGVPAGAVTEGVAATTPSVLSTLLKSLLLPLVLVPGMLACWWRLSRHRRRFGRRMASQGFMELRRELAQARRIHESLFPPPTRREDIEFDLLYRPMREVGGDFAQAWTDPLDRFNVVVIDVTGHGLAAAMTVNRIAGELDRIRAENPLISPGAVLAGLNRYIHLTLAKHVVFATAVAAQLDPHTGRLVIANAGHPAAVLRRTNGEVEFHESSAFILGALAHTEFEVSESVVHVGASDVLILVTDGVLEARDRRGRVFGESRLREACSRQPPPPRWSEFLAWQIDQWSGGVLYDDLLIATLALAPTARVIPRTASRADTLRELRSGEVPVPEPVAALTAGTPGVG